MAFGRRGLFSRADNPRDSGGFRVTLSSDVVDADFSNVVLLLDFAGTDGDTNFTDLSNSAHVETFINTIEIDDDIQFLGVNTLLTVGGGVVTIPDSADWDFGTGDFTVEFGGRTATDWTGQRAFISVYDAPDGWWVRSNAGALEFGEGDTVLKSETHSMATDGTVHHIAVSRIGTNLRMFIDGVELGSATTDSTDLTGSTVVLSLGVLTGLTTQRLLGSIGALRVTNGIGRYSAGFTPPTVFYPTS